MAEQERGGGRVVHLLIVRSSRLLGTDSYASFHAQKRPASG
jgi:hypothetical protein